MFDRNKKKERVFDVLSHVAREQPDHPALQSVSSSSFAYKDLLKQIDLLSHRLKEHGFSKTDRLALVFPQGPEMAVACLFGLSNFCIAPLNPAYTEKEFVFYFNDIEPEALITLKGFESCAVKVARDMNLKIFSLFWDSNRRVFDLESEGGGKKILKEKDKGSPLPQDTALVMHTSGTTSRPKLVPLSQRNITVSALNTVKTLQLTSADRCLNLMPVFHIHGLVVTLSCIFGGGTVINTPSFDGESFFDWLDKLGPTWYTGAPTMHQEILRIAPEKKEILNRVDIKKIRSSSSPLPAEVLEGLEETFQAVVAESYGMTEAALQITSNQLPPGKRKPGSAGQADGVELAVINENGDFLKQGEIGEIVIKGENVSSGYENNEEANKESFWNGWFRTGDLGYLDKDDFLFIKGRLKEMINRGGENISPREIDEAMLKHSGIEQAVAFSMPHKTLGEEVGAAVVLKKDVEITEKEIRNFLKSEIAEFKIPKKYFFVSEIPKGPSGKLKRINLYDQLKKESLLQSLEPRERRNIVSRCLKIAICLENKNENIQEYQENVVKAYKKAFDLFIDLDTRNSEVSQDLARQSIDMLDSVMKVKRTDKKERIDRWQEVFKDRPEFLEEGILKA